ncbi:TetR family transcriptional regulator [Mycolicibacterium moriokaense]|jgi:AcrR family transcriptional regulator|uniref:TetR family transcriptional regulator n=1 Tax=Mycolicibacterium moriokaense TaxID=39691 RepID=A0AAD1HIK0_9MYCO|nr:TetR/AcrR family transcriptional regulator [Mycolicibacterium moriokaense]MCV7042111.1 TetR/AcrR family transcriptional regulator [Mycolicibacterium moriokaense]ORB25179.1 TetR family transcriptional regulator [Mycolicibacterium moriokaense]BBX04881.1 TetR family transcriptional regulator [Mycolicibacterium moriokaense]
MVSGKGERTRERLLGAAVGEFRRAGVAGADVKAIAADAGVSPATFYFHFPTKEHVLIELERREEDRIAGELIRFFGESPGLPAALAKVVEAVGGLEDRLGATLFKDFLALHFSSARPPEEIWTNHPVIVAVVDELRRARDRGLIPHDVDPLYSGVFFLVGLYALMITLPSMEPARSQVLEQYVRTSLYGMRIEPTPA